MRISIRPTSLERLVRLSIILVRTPEITTFVLYQITIWNWIFAKNIPLFNFCDITAWTWLLISFIKNTCNHESMVRSEDNLLITKFEKLGNTVTKLRYIVIYIFQRAQLFFLSSLIDITIIQYQSM